MSEQVNIDSLLDGTLDDLADVPEFKNFPNGAHRATVTFERKEVNKHPSVEVKLTAMETVELTNPTDDTPLEKGATASVLYMLDNDLGQGKFKEIMKAFAAVHGNKKLTELMEESQNSEVLVVTSQRPNKEKTKMYMDIDTIQLV